MERRARHARAVADWQFFRALLFLERYRLHPDHQALLSPHQRPEVVGCRALALQHPPHSPLFAAVHQ